MPVRKKILEDLEAINTMKNLVQSYEEVSVIRMQKLKDSVLKMRDFLSELSDVYVDLKSSYNREIKELLKKMKEGDKEILSTLQKNGKTLLVYLSSNGKLYGAVTQKTFRLFVQDAKQTEADLLVIGSAGKELVESSLLNKPFEYFEIPDTNVEISHIKNLVEKFLPYEKVYVYYGKFGNVIKQEATSTSITGEDIFETDTPTSVPREDKFIFEPTLEKIFNFFATQIMANLFSQTLLENQLARFASRVNAMEEALIHIEQETKRLNRERIRNKHQLQNKKQLETISGLVLWGG